MKKRSFPGNSATDPIYCFFSEKWKRSLGIYVSQCLIFCFTFCWFVVNLVNFSCYKEKYSGYDSKLSWQNRVCRCFVHELGLLGFVSLMISMSFVLVMTKCPRFFFARKVVVRLFSVRIRVFCVALLIIMLKKCSNRLKWGRLMNSLGLVSFLSSTNSNMMHGWNLLCFIVVGVKFLRI